MGRVFANGLGDRGSTLDRVILKIQKVVLDAALVKWSNLGHGVAPSPKPWCNRY